jgi:hypothetical protein
MTSFRNALIAGVSALGVVAGSMPAMAASAKSEPTVGGVKMSDIQQVDRRGWGGGRGGWGGGGRGYYRSGWGGGRGWGGGGRRYYGGYRHRGYGYGGYAAAGILGLAAGAALASPGYGYGYGDGYYGDDGYYGGRSYSYYDRPYRRSYGYSRAAYGGAECQVISHRRDRYGYPVKVIRYRPC